MADRALAQPYELKRLLALPYFARYYKGLFSTPSSLYLRHWSNGNPRSSQGPPKEPTVANVGWLRAFFNSSSMTEDDHRSFARKCREADTCQLDDRALRGFSSYPQVVILEWKQIKKTRPKGWPEIAIAIACISLTALLLLSPIWKRMRDRLDKRAKPKTRGRRQLGTSNFRQQLFLQYLKRERAMRTGGL